jgi:N-acetylglutamate synthase-like GNAT family acetyltransferase
MEFKIRAAKPADAEAIAHLSRELGYPAELKTIRERLRRILGRDDQRVVVAEVPNGGVCGWLQAHSSVAVESGLRVEIVGLIVSEKMRRRGVGRSLVAQSNAKRVESKVFYPSLGFLPSKTQVVYRKSAVI